MRTIPQVLAELPDTETLRAMFAELIDEQTRNMTVAAQDQIRAAGSEARLLVDRVKKEGAWAAGDGGPETFFQGALVLMVGMAQRGVKDTCPHLPEPGGMLASPQPVILDLGHRIAQCRSCAGQPGVADDDGLCDYCQRPTVEFYPIMGAVGPVTWHGDFCEECRDGFLTIVPVE